jgi:hypothetical protein
MTVQTTPQVILAGVDYSGVPTAEWIGHMRLRIESDAVTRRVERETRYAAVFAPTWSEGGTAARLDRNGKA